MCETWGLYGKWNKTDKYVILFIRRILKTLVDTENKRVGMNKMDEEPQKYNITVIKTSQS